MGLGRAFLLAGAQAVIVGLWDIPDEATELLMRCFYNLARQKGWTSSSAMQHAMHQVRCFDRFALPRYWAGFEIMGRQVILNFERPLKDYNTYWDAVVPRSLTQQQALPCLHLNIFNDVIQWLHSPTSSTGMLINGPAATGKTVLATQIAKYFTYAFVESHVVWLDFSNAASLRQSAQLALKQWHEVNSLPSSTAASAPYAFAMATGSGGGGSDDSSSKNSLAQLLQAMGQSSFAYLLILDGLDELSLLQCSTEVMSFISNSVVGALPPRLLATSRSPLLIDMGDLCDFHQVTTSLLSSEDSLLAMLQLTAEANPSPMLNECDAYHLSELCQKYLSGGYPLMADQLADRVGLYPSCSFTTLKQSLDKAAGAAAAAAVTSKEEGIGHRNSGLAALQDIFAENSPVPRVSVYRGLDPDHLRQVNMPEIDDGSDSGLSSTAPGEPSFSLTYLLSTKANTGQDAGYDVDEYAGSDVDTDVDVGDLLRCLIHATCPVRLPLLFIARQASKLVYNNPDAIFKVSEAGGAVGHGAALDNADSMELLLDAGQEVGCIDEPDCAFPSVTQKLAQLDRHGFNKGADAMSSTAYNRNTSMDQEYLTLDGLHGWLSLLDVIGIDRVEPTDTVDEPIPESKLAWHKQNVSYSYATIHALEAMHVAEEEVKRRMTECAKAITDFLNDRLTCSFELTTVETMIEAGLHIGRQVLRKGLEFDRDSADVIRAMLNSSLIALLGIDEHEGRFIECLEVQTMVNEHFSSCVVYPTLAVTANTKAESANRKSEALIPLAEQESMDRLLHSMFVINKWPGDMTDLKPGSMRFAADHHLVVVSSPMSGPGKYTLDEFGADTEHFSVATGVQRAPFTGFEVLSDAGEGREKGHVWMEEVFRLLYGLICLHGKSSPVCRGMWSIDESGIVQQGRALSILVIDCGAMQAKALPKARVAGEEKEITEDVRNLGSLMVRQLQTHVASSLKLQSFVKRCNGFESGSVAALWELSRGFTEWTLPCGPTAV